MLLQLQLFTHNQATDTILFLFIYDKNIFSSPFSSSSVVFSATNSFPVPNACMKYFSVEKWNAGVWSHQNFEISLHTRILENIISMTEWHVGCVEKISSSIVALAHNFGKSERLWEAQPPFQTPVMESLLTFFIFVENSRHILLQY